MEDNSFTCHPKRVNNWHYPVQRSQHRQYYGIQESTWHESSNEGKWSGNECYHIARHEEQYGEEHEDDAHSRYNEDESSQNSNADSVNESEDFDD